MRIFSPDIPGIYPGCRAVFDLSPAFPNERNGGIVILTAYAHLLQKERMTKMKKVFVWMLALSMLFLWGCTREEGPVPSSEGASQPVPQESREPAQPEVESRETQQTQPPLLYANPLTGEGEVEPVTARPFTVSYNNVQAALPQYGISQAQMVYEFLTEGGTTRCIGLFTDIGSVEEIGSIRSARQYFVELSLAYDAVFVHAGGSEEAQRSMRQLDMGHLDALVQECFYRSQTRLSDGYALEHTLFGRGAEILEAARGYGCYLSYEEPTDYGLSFSDDAVPDGEGAEKVKITYGVGNKSTTMTYDPETGLYLGSQFGRDWVDGATGETLGFRNVLVLFTDCYMQSDGVHWTVELTGRERRGMFACGGRLVPIVWSHDSVRGDFVYTLEDGTPLELGIGTSYVAVVPMNSSVAWE